MDPDKLTMITALGPMIGIGIVAISAELGTDNMDACKTATRLMVHGDRQYTPKTIRKPLNGSSC